MDIVETFDVVIVGGGPAGLSAGLVLGRCGRRVVIFDHGKYRNARARAMHGYLTRDGTPPGELLTIGREEVRRYGVELRQAEVVEAACEPGRFEVRLNDGSIARSRKLLLATGCATTCRRSRASMRCTA
jgi:thioredoxin reductase